MLNYKYHLSSKSDTDKANLGVLIMKLSQLFFGKKQDSTSRIFETEAYSSASKEPLGINLKENLKKVQQTLGNSSDIIFRVFQAGKSQKTPVGIIYTEGLVDLNFINDFILETLLVDLKKVELNTTAIGNKNFLQALKSLVLPIGDIRKITDFNELFLQLLSGNTILLIDGFSQGIALSSKGWADRGVKEPSSETVVRGPKDGFNETLRTNTSLLRRRIKDPNLWIETTIIGKRTKTDVAIAYIKGLASDNVIQEVHKRLNKIDIDGILESGYIEEFIQDSPYSPFPTVYNSERPDKIAAGVLEAALQFL